MDYLIVLTTLIAGIQIHSCRAQLFQAPEQLSGLLPPDLMDFYNNLSPQQEKIIDQAVDSNDGDEQGFLR